jgi:hypothetical protein
METRNETFENYSKHTGVDPEYYLEPWYFYPDHLNSSDCWCEPELEYEDAETGNQVWVHREVH